MSRIKLYRCVRKVFFHALAGNPNGKCPGAHLRWQRMQGMCERVFRVRVQSVYHNRADNANNWFWSRLAGLWRSTYDLTVPLRKFDSCSSLLFLCSLLPIQSRFCRTFVRTKRVKTVNKLHCMYVLSNRRQPEIINLTLLFRSEFTSPFVNLVCICPWGWWWLWLISRSLSQHSSGLLTFFPLPCQVRPSLYIWSDGAYGAASCCTYTYVELDRSIYLYIVRRCLSFTVISCAVSTAGNSSFEPISVRINILGPVGLPMI